jgi:hypothetical protein
MTLLIIGGMLIVALLAILGAVFLSVSDQRANKAQANENAPVSSPGTMPLVGQSSATNPAIERNSSQKQNLPLTVERPLNSSTDGQQQYALNGQFHELTMELQTLYQHAWELERRLRTLAEVADRIEKTQNNQISAETEIRTQSPADSTL